MSVEQEIAALEPMGLEELRREWRRRYSAPPKLRSVEMVRLLLAWRIQEAVHGGLDADTRRLLRSDAKRPGDGLAPGSRLTREWKGRRHEVEVTSDGILYAGDRYRSLSEVARAITGSRWNGPRFFGLRQAS